MLDEESFDGERIYYDSDGNPYSRETILSSYRFLSRPDRSRSRKPKGILPPKPYVYAHVTYQNPIGTIKSYIGSRQVGVMADTMRPPLLNVPQWLVDSAVNSALTKLKDQRINLGVAMAEAQETANFVAKAARDVYRGYKRLAHGDPKGAARALLGQGSGAIPNKWLEHQYGLNPLLQDIKGAVDELQRVQPWSWVTTVRSHKNDRFNGYHHSASSWGLTEVGKLPVFQAVHHEAKVVLSYRPKQYALQSIARLGLSNPFEVVWEKTPFSFVLDWFLPVGDALGTLDATVGWDFLQGSITRFSRCKFSSPGWIGSSDGYFTVTDLLREGKGESVNFVREVLLDSPGSRTPSVKNPLSLGHLANGLSLLASVFGRSR